MAEVLKYLSQEVVDSFAAKTPAWGPVGEVTFYRSYSRWLPEKSRRESWTEVVTRVVEYSMSLDNKTPLDQLQCEANDLFDTIWNMRAFPAGRTLWIGGTEHVKNNGLANFNCSFHCIEHVDDFHDLVKILMEGAGGGLGLQAESVAKFNSQGKLTGSAEIIIKPYEYVGTPGGEGDKVEWTSYAINSHRAKRHIRFTVGDSREGWAEFTRDFLKAYLFGEYRTITVNVNRIRPHGTPLKTFGGRASGPEALIKFIETVKRVRKGKRLIDDVMLLDIGTSIGEMVVSGGTRRSALIALGDMDSKKFVGAKTIASQWWEKSLHRTNANNSIVFYEQPSREDLFKYFQAILDCGEPGLVNGAAALRRRYDWKGLNACAEILLRSKGFCNLVTLNLTYLANADEIDVLELTSDTELIARHNMRITNSDIKGIHPDWDKNQKEDRLMGISFTGYGDYVAVRGEDSALKLLRGLRKLIKNVVNEYAHTLRIPIPLLVTTVKPEGTISLLYGCSSGLHDPYSPYYIRNIRISKSDAVSEALIAMGVHCEQNVQAGKEHEWVFSFPIKTNATCRSEDKSPVEQLDRYFKLMGAWVDHNASNTIYITKEDVPDIVDKLLENWDSYVAVSFMAKSEFYPQLPFQAIDEEEYEIAMAKHPNLRTFARVLESIEKEMTGTDDLEGCETGSCPAR